MKKCILAIALLGTLSTQANAAFWDSWFGGSDEKQESANSAGDVLKDAGKQILSDKAKQVTQPVADKANSAASTASGLLPMLTSQLNVSEQQAQGGMGALLQVAQSNLSGDEFKKLGSSIPNMDTLMAAAPLLGDKGSQVAGLLSKAGGVGEKIGTATKLASQFKSLNMDSGMIGKFAQIAMGFLNGNGDGTASLLQKGLGSILGGGQ